MKAALIGRYGEGEILPGPERIARELYLQLKKKNSDVIFIEYFFSGYSDYSFLKKIFGRKINDNGVLRLGIIPLTLKLIKEQFDVIHLVNIQRFLLIVFLFKPFLKSRFLSSFHGLFKDEVNYSKLKRDFLDLWIEKISVKKSDILIFPSNLLVNIFKQHYNLSEDKCRIIYNGVHESFRKRSIQFEEKEKYNFVYFNSFGRGLHELIYVLSGMADIQINIFVIGREEKLDNPNKNIEITFVKYMNQDTLIDFLKEKHFVIKSSSFDSFSIFTAECMSMGIIPIVSENTGIKELIENNTNGFIYNSNRREDLTNLLNEIVQGKYDLQKISMNASEIYNKLSWEEISDQYISLYKTAV